MTNAPGRFIVGHFRGGYGRTVILRDIGFWAEHEQALDQWGLDVSMGQDGPSPYYTVVDEQKYLLFELKYAGHDNG